MSDEQIKQDIVKRPLTYAIYKGMGGKQGCFQFNLAPAYTSSNPKRLDGAVFVEAAKTISKNTYDWDNKIVFAMKVNDLGMLLSGFNIGECSILHDQDAGTDQRNTRTKSLSLKSGKTPGTFFLSLSQKDKETVSISLSPYEARILCTLIEAAIPKVQGW